MHAMKKLVQGALLPFVIFTSGILLLGCEPSPEQSNSQNSNAKASSEQGHSDHENQTDVTQTQSELKSGNMFYIARDVADVQFKAGGYVEKLTQAQADGQADAQLAGFTAKALQPGQEETEQGEDQQAGIRMAGGPETQAGAAGTQAAEHQHAQHAHAMQRVGLRRLEGSGRSPEKTGVCAEQAEQQGQGAAQAGDHGRAPGGRPGMPA